MECSCFIDFQDLFIFVSDLVISNMYCTHDMQSNSQMHDTVDFLHRAIAHPAHFELLMKLLCQGHTVMTSTLQMKK